MTLMVFDLQGVVVYTRSTRSMDFRTLLLPTRCSPMVGASVPQ